MNFQYLVLLLVIFMILELGVMNQNYFFFSLFHYQSVLPLYFYNQFILYPNNIKNLIMMKRFALALFRNRNQSKYFYSSYPKQNQEAITSSKRTIEQKQFKQKDSGQTYQQFEKQDRTTPGWILYRILFWSSTAILAYNTYLVSQHNKETPVQEQPTAVPGFIGVAKTIYQLYNQSTEFLTKPPCEKLLPDAIHPLIQPKTLVLNMSGTLLKSQYVFGKGLIVHKRPGLQNFLKKMSQIYQVVVFSNQDNVFLSSIVPTIDPRHEMISYTLGNQCMVLSKGHYVKDLKYLNRDPQKIIVIDQNKKNVKTSQNVIVLPEYKGDQGDKQLHKLSKLLEKLADSSVKDVRKTLAQMGQNPIQANLQNIKMKIQHVKNNKINKLFGLF